MQGMLPAVNPLQPVIHVIGAIFLISAILAMIVAFMAAVIFGFHEARSVAGNPREKIIAGISASMVLIIPVAIMGVIVYCAVTGIINWFPLVLLISAGMTGVGLSLYSERKGV